MCQPSYRSPQTITNRSVKLCLIIYVLSYPAPHTNRSVKCPTHHTPHDHQQVSEVMSNNIIVLSYPTPLNNRSVFYPSHSSQSPTGLSVTSKSEGIHCFVLPFTPHNHQQADGILFFQHYTFWSPTSQKVCSVILSYPSHLR